jgi:ribonucleoside-diphosphate reductase alpha chain
MTTGLSAHALSVLEKRFLLRDESGELIEDPTALFRRVARTIAAVDEIYQDFRPRESEEVFYDLMTSSQFLPNSPTLMNAGTAHGQLAGF